MFPDNLYISDPTAGLTYIVENDTVDSSKTFHTHDVYAYLICQNMVDVYTINRSKNSISWYRNLECIGDIRVGSNPWGICEDPTGRIYVSNYGDNTVSVIEDGKLVRNIPIWGRGPKGIVSDANGVIYVACYLSNSVCKIVNKTVVDNIPVAYNPEGITCSPFGEVWVTCSGSNVVVKLLKNGGRYTCSTGKCPVAVVADKKGNVFVANFEEDTVTQLSTVDGTVKTIPVGDGPNAISINSKGFIYVTSNLSGEKIFKINPDTSMVIDRIEVCKSQSAFGDFTGCATYNCFHPWGEGSGSGIDSDTIESFVEALKPTAKVIEFVEQENGSYNIKIGSDLLDITAFDHLSVNGVTEKNADGSYTIPADMIGEDITVKGYFDTTDEKPINFESIKLKNVFPIEIGILDNDYTNYTKLNSGLVNFDVSDVTSLLAKQETDGHLVFVLPARVFDSVKESILVQGMQEIADSWSTELLSDEAKANITAAITIPNSIVLVNSLVTDANERWLFQVFRGK